MNAIQTSRKREERKLIAWLVVGCSVFVLLTSGCAHQEPEPNPFEASNDVRCFSGGGLTYCSLGETS